MEIIVIAVAVVVLGAIWYANRKTGFDANNDGKVDLKDAAAAVKNTVQTVKNVADANKDGKVDAKDAKAAASKATTAVKKAAVRAKTNRNTKRK